MRSVKQIKQYPIDFEYKHAYHNIYVRLYWFSYHNMHNAIIFNSYSH